MLQQEKLMKNIPTRDSVSTLEGTPLKKLGEIDYSLEIPKYEISLHKPNKDIVNWIGEAFDIVYNEKANAINELSFKIPTKLEVDHAIVDNPHIDEIKHRYLFKLKRGRFFEYFLFLNENKNHESFDYVDYKAYSLGIELADKPIRKLSLESAKLDEMASELLKDTLWRVGYIDSEFLMKGKDRSFELLTGQALQGLFETSKIYNCLLQFNTDKRTIDFIKPQDLGKDNGMVFTPEKHIDRLQQQSSSEKVVTRLYAYGKETLDISGVTPNGQPYLEDYSYYMYPYEEDSSGKVIQSSYYMADDLVKALKRYDKKVSDSADEFKRLKSLYNMQVDLITDQEQILADYKIELRLAWDSLDVSNKDEKSGTPEHDELIRKKREWERRVAQQETHLASLKGQLEQTEKELDDLYASLKLTNNLTPAEYQELNPYIIGEIYTNDAIEEDEDLLEEAKKVFEKIKQPKITLSLSIEDFMSNIEFQHEWQELGLGDTIRVVHEGLEINSTAIITEINHNHENNSVSLRIENEKAMKDSDEYLNILQSSIITGDKVDLNKWEWDLSRENNGLVNQIIHNAWDATKQRVEAGYLQEIEISERGIIARSPDTPKDLVIIQAGLIALSRDGGETWKTAITPEGIVAERLFGRIIAGERLIIEDADGVWITEGSTTTIYKRDPNNPNIKYDYMKIGRLDDNCYGIKSYDDVVKVEVSSCEGFAISKWDLEKDDWSKTFWVDPRDGTLYAKNMVTEGLKIVNSIGDVILDAEKDFMDLGALQNILSDLVITPMEKIELTKMMYRIHEEFFTRYIIAQDYYYSQRNTVYDFEGEYKVGKGFDIIKSKNDIEKGDKILGRYDFLILYYSFLLEEIEPYLSFEDGKPPQIYPDESIHDIIAWSGGTAILASDFVPQNIRFQFGTELMRKNSEVTLEERRILTKRFSDVWEELRKFDKEMEDMIFYSGLQMGEYYNNVIVDDHGFIAVRNDGMYRAFLNATHGLALQRWEDGRWVSKLYATLGHPDWEDGTLYAEGLVTKNLRIVDGELGEKIVFDHNDGITIYGNNGEVIRLNGNVGINIHVDGEKRFWVGTDGYIYAKKMHIMGDDTEEMIKDVDGSYVSDLTVNRLKTLNSNVPQDYVHIQDNFFAMKTNRGGVEVTKFYLTVQGTGADAYPHMTWGSGGAGGVTSNVAHEYKDGTGYYLNYTNTSNSKSGLNLVQNAGDMKHYYAFSDKGMTMEANRTQGDKTSITMADYIQLKSTQGTLKLGKDKFEIQIGSSYFSMDANSVKIKSPRLDLDN